MAEPPNVPGSGSLDRLIERTILALLERRAAGATICPSEVARKVGDEGWRDLMDVTRAAARRLAAEGQVEITQGGRVVDKASAKGPVRIRLVRGAEDLSSRPPFVT
ncbi:MAG: DUF3253 domain-containing protein [Actinomycetota bacterium]|nr:DUF3253 domain-containing protein [Actinomycetota bacterium]